MQVLMRVEAIFRLMLAGLCLVAGAWIALAQDAAEKPAKTDGYDRPTTYPKIRFGSKKKEEGKEGAADKGEAPRKTKSRVYLLDLSDAMAASITIDGSKETTRMEHMRSMVGRALDDLAKQPDAKGGVLSFNLVTFGSVQDFAKGGDPLEANAENTGKAKEWLKDLVASGKPDLHALLSECFKQEPDSAALLVGSMPGKPSDVSEDELKKFDTVGDFIVDLVKRQRAAGKKTTLDVFGVGLSREQREFYEKLAKAGGGNYLDG
jgi:hypothetical protein